VTLRIRACAVVARAIARLAAPLATAALAIALPSAPAGAQVYFGQNLVQYDRLNWRVLETEHFLVHYYPVEKEAAYDAARMAERSYARLSRLLQHQFREKKPIILFASRGDFAQSNVFGDLGEGTGGVTDPLRQRMAQPFTGDYRSFEHVLMHEMVHAFQFDIFSRGRAGANLQTLSQVNPPLWFMEGMAEFLSLGYGHPQTDAWVRDAAINGNLPSVRQMTERPDQFFPYRYGFSLWQYVGQRWGDQAVGEIMNAVPNLGIERAFKRELGLSLEELSDEWKEAMQLKHLPQIAQLERARKFAQPLLTQRRTGGIADFYIAPALSPDGRNIAFISYGNLLRGEVFPDLYLADAQTGKRIKRLVKSTTNADVEELRQLYSQSSFSPDGRLLAYTAQRRGKDVLYILDVRKRETIRRLDLPLEQVLSPTWSPDGRQLVMTGNVGGLTDLYLVNADGTGLRQLTKDRFGDMQPSWSPDGKTIAFASDRDTDFEVLRLARWKISLLDLATGQVTEVPDQDGLNINPQWAPDGRSIAFVSDRTGTANLFLYDLDAKEHFQLTNVVGAVNSQTEFSPAISWAHKADVLAFVYYEKGTNNVWSIRNPRLLRRQPFRATAPAATIAGGAPGTPGAPAAAGTPARRRSRQPCSRRCRRHRGRGRARSGRARDRHDAGQPVALPHACGDLPRVRCAAGRCRHRGRAGDGDGDARQCGARAAGHGALQGHAVQGGLPARVHLAAAGRRRHEHQLRAAALRRDDDRAGRPAGQSAAGDQRGGERPDLGRAGVRRLHEPVAAAPVHDRRLADSRLFRRPVAPAGQRRRRHVHHRGPDPAADLAGRLLARALSAQPLRALRGGRPRDERRQLDHPDPDALRPVRLPDRPAARRHAEARLVDDARALVRLRARQRALRLHGTDHGLAPALPGGAAVRLVALDGHAARLPALRSDPVQLPDRLDARLRQHHGGP
jgi:hypothetical protein